MPSRNRLCGCAEWHFFATSHGKGPCDGVDGTVKQLAAKASLQRPYEMQIMTPRQLYEFGLSDLKAINFHYATVEEHDREANFLKERFLTARTIAGTDGLHAFRPLSREKLEVRDFSSSPTMREEQVSLCKEVNVPCPTIRGYVTAIYDGHWWLACVLMVIPDSGYQVQLLRFMCTGYFNVSYCPVLDGGLFRVIMSRLHRSY